MRHNVLRFVIGISLIILLSRIVLAHSPYLMVVDNEDGTIDITAGYSNGASGAGVNILLKSKESGNILWQGRLDSLGEITCPKQKVPYIIVFDGGPGHVLEKEGIKTSATPVTKLYPLDKNFEHVKDIFPEPILIQDSNGIIRAVTIMQGYRYHHGKGLGKIMKRLEEKKKKGVKIDFKINDVGLCLGVTSGYLSLKFAISELYGKEIPRADDFKIIACGKMCCGVMDMYSIYFGKKIKRQDITKLGQKEISFTAQRVSTGEKIAFKYNFKVIPEMEKFFLVKSNPGKFKDVDFMGLKRDITKKLFSIKDFSYFEKIE